MSRFYRLLIVLLFCGTFVSYSQQRIYPDYNSSSGFELDSLDAYDPLVLDNLETLARVWGFVKYHHPAMADTTIHIDYELFGLLPRVAHAGKAERNRILSEWINELGSFEVDTTFQQELSAIDHILINDFSWVEDTVRLGSKLSQTLSDLRYAISKSNKYVWNEGVTIKLYDDPFPNYDYNHLYDAGYRLLILFRLWNAIDSYCPNRNITDTSWDKVLEKYIPRMILDKDSYILTQLELLSELNDTHASGPYSAIFGAKRAPVLGQLVEGRLFVTDTFDNQLLLPGDEITVIGGRSISEIISMARKYTAQSNESVLMRDAADYAFWTPKDSLNLVFQRNGQQYQIKIPSIELSDYYAEKRKSEDSKVSFRMLNDSVSYIYAGTLQSEDAQQIYNAIKDTKTLIVDLRCYPRDYFTLYNFFAEYLIHIPQYPTKIYRPDWGCPGYFFRIDNPVFGKQMKTDPSNPGTWHNVENHNAYTGKIIILVDQTTQSAAEYFTMHLQSIPDAITVGSQTAGADGDIVLVTMPGYMNFYFSSVKVLYPDGTDTQRRGVRVDIEVRPSVDGIRNNRDEVLEYALQLATKS